MIRSLTVDVVPVLTSQHCCHDLHRGHGTSFTGDDVIVQRTRSRGAAKVSQRVKSTTSGRMMTAVVMATSATAEDFASEQQSTVCEHYM